MDVKVTRDRTEEIAASGLQMDPERHKVMPACDWLRRLIEATGNDRLFIYAHRVTARFMLAEWIHKPYTYGQGLAVCHEIMVLPGHPNRCEEMPDPRELAQDFRPESEISEEAMRRQQAADADWLNKHEASRVEKRESMRMLGRKGMANAVEGMRTSLFIGREEGGEEFAQTEDVINTLANPKIWSLPPKPDKGDK